MSIAAVLTSNKVDAGLDEIFNSSAGPSTVIQSVAARVDDRTVLKRKSECAGKDKSLKRSRISEVDRTQNKAGKEARKGKKAQVREEDTKGLDEDDSGASDSNSDDDAPPEHESLRKSNRRKKDAAKKMKFVPVGETQEQRDARSIFIGNLPVNVVKSRPLTKQLKRHILSYVPSAKIESVRFRSVAFQSPTSALDLDDDEGPSAKQKRQQKRAADWREQPSGSKKDAEEAAEDKKGEKTYLTPAQKRRLAAIRGNLHEHAAATSNAYVVFAHPVPRDPQLRIPRKEVMDPFEAAHEAARKCTGTQFAGHTIRVDVVGKAKETEKEGDDGPLTDAKLSVFVGNLDFASGDDDVRAFFEKLMCEERGKPKLKAKAASESDEGDDDESDEEGSIQMDVLLKPRWVTRVRIVRDRDTQLGKGFAYVQFSDRDCVDETFALEPEKLKFAKRTLRVQRCKTLAGASAAKAKPLQTPSKVSASAGATSAPRSRAGAKAQAFAAVVLPKGDPTLGTRLAGLSKVSRKEAKAADAARVARRLAKKKARLALEKAGVKEGRGKGRVRERKEKRSAVNKGRKEGKKRVRSERNVEKRNMKK